MTKLHAIVFCWPRKVEDAVRICKSLGDRADRITVIDASPDTVERKGSLEWVKVDPACYFGHKFAHAIRCFEGDILLQIQADASHPDWGAIAALCRRRFAEAPALGIWSPEIDFTTWPTSRVKLYQCADPELTGVVQTDCIVWAIRAPVVDYLRRFDYSGNNLGWGIDWAAIGHCYAHRALVLRDAGGTVRHPQGSGYDQNEAFRQMAWFLRQLGDAERIQCKLLSGYLRYGLPV